MVVAQPLDQYRTGQTDPITPSNFTNETAGELWKRVAARFTKSRDRIQRNRDLMDGRGGLASPYADDAADDAGPRDDPPDDPWDFTHPQRKLFALNLTNALSDERPDIERRARGGSETQRANSESVEEFLRAALEEALDFDGCYGKATQDGEWALVVTPQTADYLHIPSWEDRQKARIDGTDHPDDVEPAKGWWRDGDGNPTDSRKAMSREQTVDAYNEAFDAAMDRIASNFPVSCRLVSATDCVPILVQGRGKRRFDCQGLLVRTLVEPLEMLGQGWRWEGMGNTMLIPNDWSAAYTYGARGQVYLYEVYSYVWKNGMRRPMVAYSLGGMPTWKVDGEVDEAGRPLPRVIDLWEEYGIDKLLVGYYWGMHLERDNPDDRGVPVTEPIGSVMIAAEANVNASNAHTWQTAFGGHVIVPNERIPESVYLETGDDQEQRFKSYTMPGSGEVAVWPGKPEPIAPAQLSPDAHRMADRLLTMLEQSLPDAAVMGGQQATDRSGRSLSIASTLMKVSRRQIREGVRQCVEDAAEYILRCVYGLSKKYGVPVPLYVPAEAAPDDPNAPTEQVLQFKPAWLGQVPVFGLRAYWPNIGNLADVQQTADLYARNMASFEDLMEVRGKTNVELERAKIAMDRWFNSPEGLQDQMASAWEWRGEADKAKALELQLAQKLTKSGMPAAAVAPEAQAAVAAAGAPGAPPGQAGQAGAPAATPQPPPGAGPAMPGMGLPNVAASSLGGIVAGDVGMGQQVADATAQMGAAPGMAGGR